MVSEFSFVLRIWKKYVIKAKAQAKMLKRQHFYSSRFVNMELAQDTARFHF